MSCACLVSERGVKDRLIYVNSDGELIFTVKGEKTEIICKDVSCDFDVTADRGGVGIAVVSLAGALLYLNFSGGEWRKYTILDSRKSGKKINGVHLLKINGRLHAFYCIEYEGRMMLIHHIIDGERREPSVIDYVGLRCVYDVCADENMNIHILYADESAHLKYTVFSNSQKRYVPSDFATDDEVRGVSCVFADALCAAYLTREREYNVINCVNLSTGEKHTVGFGVDALSEPCIFTDGKTVFVQWCEKGYAFECSADGSFKFSRARSVGQSGGTLCVRSPYNESLLCIKRCAAAHTKTPLASAASVFSALCTAAKPAFEPKGTDVQKFAAQNAESFDEGYPKDVLYDLERRLGELEVRFDELAKAMCAQCAEPPKTEINPENVGDVDEENLELFQKTEISQIYADEYVNPEEEL